MDVGAFWIILILMSSNVQKKEMQGIMKWKWKYKQRKSNYTSRKKEHMSK